MSVIIWLVVGLIAGSVAARIAKDEGVGFIVDLVIGAAGALAGGLIYSSFGLISLSAVAPGVVAPGAVSPSLLAACLAAVIGLAIYHAILSRGWF